jgi:hypothetical protein
MVTVPSVGEHQHFVKISDCGQLLRGFWQRIYYFLRPKRYYSLALQCGKFRDGLRSILYSFGDFAYVSKALCTVETCYRPVGIVIWRQSSSARSCALSAD